MSEQIINIRKAAMIGCGFVGAASVFSLMQSGLFSEIVLIDADKEKAEGEAMDISHGIPFTRPMKIYAGDYDDIVDAAIIIITAGANQKPDETRLDLVHKNCPNIKHYICLQNLLKDTTPNVLTVRDLIFKYKGQAFMPDCKPEDLAMLIYTSGTTGPNCHA